MENAVEALKTAAAVLVFIIALTVAFTMFSKAKATTDAITTMQDKQEYLEAAGLDDVLYTSSNQIEAGSYSGTMTTNGDRIVGIEDVISTIYRYNIEKYGVTIIDVSSGNVIARFDSSTENIMRQWYNIKDVDKNGNGRIEDEEEAGYVKNAYKGKLISNLRNNYCNITDLKLEILYGITVTGNRSIECGAPWYGNETEILKRCNIDIAGGTYELNNQKYESKKLNEKLNGKIIIEVINEIDTSKYLKDEEDENIETNLLQEYQLPTTEIIYIYK